MRNIVEEEKKDPDMVSDSSGRNPLFNSELFRQALCPIAKANEVFEIMTEPVEFNEKTYQRQNLINRIGSLLDGYEVTESSIPLFKEKKYCPTQKICRRAKRRETEWSQEYKDELLKWKSSDDSSSDGMVD